MFIAALPPSCLSSRTPDGIGPTTQPVIGVQSRTLGSGVGEPETEMLQNPPDDRGILDGGNDPHGMLASGTDHGIGFVDLADQPGPVSLDLP